jgi:D-aminoacyl-tRNA deacylase
MVRALIQRVTHAAVLIGGDNVGTIGIGYVIFLGIKQDDTGAEAEYLAYRCADLRVFEDEQGKMNKSLDDVNGEVLVISQFTLHADTKKGNRPSFVKAALPDFAEELYNRFVYTLRERLGSHRVKTGRFRAMMDVELVNSGPVTILIQSKSEYETR